ncbi:uncharacterized, partial [Tachysurus ichikawai]
MLEHQRSCCAGVYTLSFFSQLTVLNASSSDLELSRISSASQLP